MRVITVGSRIREMHELAPSIFKNAIQHGIRIEPVWLPREENQLVDCLSKVIDYDDWNINMHVFTWVDAIWGPHTVDIDLSIVAIGRP